MNKELEMKKLLVIASLLVGVGVVGLSLFVMDAKASPDGVSFAIPHHSTAYPEASAFVSANDARLGIGSWGDVTSLWLDNTAGERVITITYTQHAENDILFCLFGYREDGTCKGWPGNIPTGTYTFGAYASGNTNWRTITYDPLQATCDAEIDVPQIVIAQEGITVTANFNGNTESSIYIGERGKPWSFCGSWNWEKNATHSFHCTAVPWDSQGLQVSVAYMCNGNWVHRVFDVGVTNKNRVFLPLVIK
jgi:hypothetical protein